MADTRIPVQQLAVGSKWWDSTGVQFLVQTPTPNQRTGYRPIKFVSLKPKSKLCDPDGKPCSLWWTVNANASEFFRVVPNSTSLTLPRFSDIENAGLPASLLQLQVEWDSSTAFVDIGPGTRFSILAPTITLGLWVPSTAVVPNKNTANQAVRTGLTTPAPVNEYTVVDAAATVSVSCSTAPIGDRIATVTRSYTPTGTDLPTGQYDGFPLNPAVAGTYEIPPRARRVQWSTNIPGFTPGVGVGPIYRSPSPAAGSIDRGQYDAWGRAMSNIHDIPRNATFVDLGLFAGSVDYLTAVWELEM